MPSYDIFFFSIILFLVGILAASLGVGFLIIIVAAIILAAIFLLVGFLKQRIFLDYSYLGEGKKWAMFAVLIVFIILGAGYYKWDDSRFRDIEITFNKEIDFGGLVIDDPQINSGTQTLTVRLNEPYRGEILVKLSLHPQFNYGDKLIFDGKISLPSIISVGRQGGSYAKYLAKKGISGLANFPEVKLAKSGLGSPTKAALFKFKNSIISSYSKILAPDQAALLAGLIFGERGGFTKEFKEAMSLSGTAHLTALSGQNITIIVMAVAAAVGFVFSPFIAFMATILFVFGFLAMTGFDSSAVRAAIMGFVVLLASLSGRVYNPRNSIALAAFLITLFNPKLLVFDIGFQLSFLAVLGIVYLRPALKKILRFGDKPGFFAWRENLLMTLSAQLAAAPLLIVNFDNFSLTAFIANVLILTAIPLTMSLGFLIGLFNFFSYYLALITGWLASLFLSYEIFVINLFAEIYLPISPGLNFLGVLVYYSALAGIIVYAKRP